MELTLNRIAEADEYTYGLLYGDESISGNKYPLAFTLEDEWHVVKIKKETRIPAGRYEIKLRTEGGLTEKYRKSFSWFSGHLHLQDVPNFKYVYIHRGNTDKSTEGCILVANTCDLTPPTHGGFIGESTDCFERLYKKVEPLLRLKKEKVFIHIKDL